MWTKDGVIMEKETYIFEKVSKFRPLFFDILSFDIFYVHTKYGTKEQLKL